MAQTAQITSSFNFTGGFNTEAGPFTFPENASIDENNFDLNIDGSRSLRNGIDTDKDFNVLGIPGAVTDDVSSLSESFYIWEYPGNTAGKSFYVAQVGANIRLYEADDDGSLGAARTTISLNTYSLLGESADLECSYSEGKGYLFITNESIYPIYLKYDTKSDSISVNQVFPRIRDIDGIEIPFDEYQKRYSNTELVGEPFQIYYYNHLNSGWPVGARMWKGDDGDEAPFESNLLAGLAFRSLLFPAASEIYHLSLGESAKSFEAVGQYNPYSDRSYTSVGNKRAPGGRIILDLFKPNRSQAMEALIDNSVGGPIPSSYYDNVPEKTAPSTGAKATAFFAGRFWLSIDDTLYYSQTIREDSNIEKFHQEADPTAENINELVATDGGTIRIAEAGKILSLYNFSEGLIVVCQKGIWYISGGEGFFSATDQSVTKVSDIRVANTQGLIPIENNYLALADEGIYLVSPEQVTGTPVLRSITRESIHTFYLGLSKDQLASMRGCYDKDNLRVVICYGDSGNLSDRRNILVYSLYHDSFTKMAISDLPGHSLLRFFYRDVVSEKKAPEQTVTINGVTVTINSNPVTIGANTLTPSQSLRTLKAFIIDETLNGSLYYPATTASFKADKLSDWETEIEGGVPYTGFLETGYDTSIQNAQDGSRIPSVFSKKTGNYIKTTFRKTESSYVDNGSGGIAYDRPSSCLLTHSWDFANTSASGKVSPQQQLYQYRRTPLPTAIGGSVDTGEPYVTSKRKIRGTGTALSLKFESEEGKDCQIVGWSYLKSGTTTV